MPTTPLTIAQESGAAWLSEFEPFTPTHAAVFACAVGAMAGAAMLGRRWRAAGEPEKEWRFRLAWSVFIIAFQCFAIAWYAWPSRFDWARSLPLHVCDLVVWLAPLALLTQWRPARTMLYFWGVGLSTQAFFTPVLQEGPTSPEFWVFWVGHTQIVGSAIYDAVALGYRPRVRDLLVAMALSLVYLGLSVALNMATGWNYGYTGPTRPEAPTLIDKLGDWPLRLISLTGLAFLAFIVAWAPWAIAGRIAPRAPSA